MRTEYFLYSLVRNDHVKYGDNIKINLKITDFVVMIEQILPRGVAEGCDQVINAAMFIR